MKSTTCVVGLGMTTGGTSADPSDHLCGKPVVGERAEFPMCREHYDLFSPSEGDD